MHAHNSMYTNELYLVILYVTMYLMIMPLAGSGLVQVTLILVEERAVTEISLGAVGAVGEIMEDDGLVEKAIAVYTKG